MKILVLGIGQVNFLASLFRQVKVAKPVWHVTVLGLRHQSRSLEVSANDVFDQILPLSSIKKRGILPLFKRRLFWQIIMSWISNHGIKGVRKLIREISSGVDIAGMFDGEYEIMHFHFIEPKNVFPILFLKRQTGIICSFWGSDLLRHSSNFEHFVVQKALAKASVITVQSLELREILLAKFGRDLSTKVNVNRFVLDEDIFQRIKSFFDGTLFEEDLEPIGTREGKVNIVIGHNAYRENSHLEIVEVLSELGTDLKNRLHLIFPMTYGLNEERRKEYMTEIKLASLKGGFSYHIIDQFLSPDALGYLRVKTDVFIHLPISDALSGAATEAMYAGSILITGAWLPYGPFRRAGLSFFEVETIEDLSPLVATLIWDINTFKKQVSENRKRLENSLLDQRGVVDTWIKIYEH